MTGRFKPIHCRRWLFLYSSLIVLIGLWGAVQGRGAGIPIWELQDTLALAKWLLKQVGVALGALLGFVPFGILFVTGLSEAWTGSSPRRKAAYLAGGGLLALFVAFLFGALRSRFSFSLAAAAFLILPGAGYGIGVWLGLSLLRKERALRWFLAKLALLAMAFLSLVGVVLGFGMEAKPLPFAPATCSSEDKRRLVELVRGKDPRRIKPGGSLVLAMTEDDANKLLAWGLAIGSQDRKARVTMDRDTVELVASARLPVLRRRPAYANIAATLEISSEPALRVRARRFALGRLEVPRWLLLPLSATLFQVVVQDAHVQPLYRAIQRCEVLPGKIALTYGRVELPVTYAADVASRIGLSGEIAQATHAHMDELVRMALQNRTGPLSMEECLQTAFRLAKKRSLQGDAVTENRGAILALGILLGHDRIQSLVGERPKEIVPLQARQRFAGVRIHGRRDWTKHFAVSAALEVLANVTTSDAAGLLKEELDAGAGGSGFSFGDLLADRAGTRFAAYATKDKPTALLAQTKLHHGISIPDVCPPAADLPEGIKAQDFERLYGGVGGEKYLQWLDLIDARIAASKFYQ
jgi:hypothetical protein